MPRATIICLAVVASAMLAGCSTAAKPLAGTRAVSAAPLGRGRIDDPRTMHYQCLKQKRIPVVKVGRTDLQIGAAPGGPRVTFLPTPGAAQQAQIGGTVEGAEVIGSALLYPNAAPDAQLKLIEDCLAEGVAG